MYTSNGRTPKGIKMINENNLQDGRAFIITSENYEDYNWNALPDGTLHVDPETGVITAKLKGETTWAPTGLKNDGTLVISKDTQFEEEFFTVKSTGEENQIFSYENSSGDKRERSLKGESPYRYVFELEKGTYMPGRNNLEVIIDGVLTRTVKNGGLEEINEYSFALNEKLEIGQTITAKYIKWTRIGNPYPRIFLNETEPETAEEGDIWIDPSGTLEEDTPYEDISDDPQTTISWDRITGKPTTPNGYKIDNQVSLVGHVHRTLDITDFPDRLPALGGDADTLKGLSVGNAPNNIVALDNMGKISAEYLPLGYLMSSKAVYIQNNRPVQTSEGTIWFCTDRSGSDGTHIEVFINGDWIKIG